MANEKAKEPVKAPEMNVPVEKLQGLLDRIDALEADKKQQGQDIAALNKTVSQTRLQEAKATLDADKRMRVHFKKIDGQTVVGWPSAPSPDVKNEIVFNPNTNMPMGEILKSRYYLADGGTTEMIDQIKLTRSTDRAYARVVEDQGDYVLVEFEDKAVLATPIRIHKQFLNA